MTAKTIWLDGELTDWDDATVHVSSYGLHYGIGFFEGIRCHTTGGGPAIFRLSDHLHRLRRSAAVYGLPLPFSVGELAEACKLVVTANGLADCYLRPIVFLGEGPHPLAAPFRSAVIATADGPLVGGPKPGGVTALISSFHRISANSIPPTAKGTGQYLNSFLAQAEALRLGADEAILLNASGYVADGWAHNIFLVRGGVLVTPPVNAGVLPGITRDTVLTLAADCGIAAGEHDLVRADLYLADEVFLTGTAAGIVPVSAVDGRVIGTGQPGPVTSQLADLLADVTAGTSGVHPEWREHTA
jgi:branched-chain amino acid aminotransferase